MERLTYHAQTLARDRTGLPERRARRLLENALDRARGAEAFTGRQRAYLAEKTRGDCRALAYNGCCVIRSGEGRCVTAYPLPAWFGRRQYYSGKERIRHVKKYMRFNGEMKGADNGFSEVQ